MITLYGMGSPNVVKVLIALDELELPYCIKAVDVFAGQQFEPDFLRLNPMAKVPVIVDSDGLNGELCTVFESGAILLYLAERTGKLLPFEPTSKYQVVQWMMVQMTTLGPMFGQFIHFMRYGPAEGNDYARERYGTQVNRVYEALNQRLDGCPYIGCHEYSIADIATYPWTRYLPIYCGARSLERFPNVARWASTIENRPAVKSAMAKLETLRAQITGFEDADPDKLDKMFGRGRYALS